MKVPRSSPNPRASGGIGRGRLCVTTRDDDLVAALSNRVKAMTFDQLACTWWPGAGVDACTRRIKRLRDAGLVRTSRAVVRDAAPPSAPLATWRPRAPEPDFAPVVAAASVRWSGPLRVVTLVTATERAATRLGGRARAPRPSETDHDLFLSQVYLKFRAERCALADRWSCEPALAPRWGEESVKVPDALVLGANPLAVEVCGSSYGRVKLRAFHAFCASRGLAYEVW